MTRRQAIAEAKSLARLHGVAYAMQKPNQPWEAVRNVPSIRFKTKVVECYADGREFNA